MHDVGVTWSESTKLFGIGDVLSAEDLKIRPEIGFFTITLFLLFCLTISTTSPSIQNLGPKGFLNKTLEPTKNKGQQLFY